MNFLFYWSHTPQAHQIFQGLGMVFTTAGLVTAFVMVDGEHFKTAWHGQLGISIMVIAYLQVIAGIIRPHAEEGMSCFLE